MRKPTYLNEELSPLVVVQHAQLKELFQDLLRGVVLLDDAIFVE